MNLKLKNNPELKLTTPLKKLTYIQGNSTAYIDTGVKMSESIIEVKVSNLNRGYRIIGKNQGIWVHSTQYMFMSVTSAGAFASGNPSGTRIIKTDCANGTYVDGSLHKGGAITDTGNANIFGNNNNFRLYYCKIYNSSGTLIHDYIPVQFTNGDVGLYDNLNESQLTSKTSDNFIAGEYDGYIDGPINPRILEKITTLYHENTPNADGLQLLNSILNVQETAENVVLNRIRVDIGNVSGSLSELMKYSTFAGFNDNYEHQTKPRLDGTWTINDWYTTNQLAQAQATFDGLTIVSDANISYDIIDEHTIHILSTTVPSVAPVFITSDVTKIYFGVGLSSSDDNALMSAFSSDSKWSSYSSLLDTWYNYLHPQS